LHGASVAAAKIAECACQQIRCDPIGTHIRNGQDALRQFADLPTSFSTGQRVTVRPQSGPFLSPPRPGLTDSVADTSNLQRGWPGLSLRRSSVRLSFAACAYEPRCKCGDTAEKKKSRARSSRAQRCHHRTMATNQRRTNITGVFEGAQQEAHRRTWRTEANPEGKESASLNVVYTSPGSLSDSG
jgi:hypothetical protein